MRQKSAQHTSYQRAQNQSGHSRNLLCAQLQTNPASPHGPAHQRGTMLSANFLNSNKIRGEKMFGLRHASDDENSTGKTITITRPETTQNCGQSTAKQAKPISSYLGGDRNLMQVATQESIPAVCLKERRSMMQINNQRMIKTFKKTLPQQKHFSPTQHSNLTHLNILSSEAPLSQPPDILSTRVSQTDHNNFFSHRTLTQKSLQTHASKRNHRNLLTELQVPEQILKMCAMKDLDQPLKVLKNAHKDIIMNHDKFIIGKHPQTATSVQEQSESQENSNDSIMLFLKDALLKILEERKWTRNKIDIDKQLDEASFIYRRVLESLPLLFSDSSSGGLDAHQVKQLQITLCLLWTLIVTSLDVTLFKQEDLIRELNSKMDTFVEERVIATRASYEQEIFTLKEIIKHKDSEIAKRDTHISEQNENIYLLKTKLRNEADKVASFRDPSGCVEFRQILQDFELNIKFLTKEKDKQYKAMRQSLRLMEEIQLDEKKVAKTEEEKRKQRAQQQEERIGTLRAQQNHLQEELDKLLGGQSRTAPLPLVRRIRRKNQQANNDQATNLDLESQLKQNEYQDKTFEEILALGSKYSSDQIEAMKDSIYVEAYQDVKADTEDQMKNEFHEFLRVKFQRNQQPVVDSKLRQLFVEFFDLSIQEKAQLRNRKSKKRGDDDNEDGPYDLEEDSVQSKKQPKRKQSKKNDRSKLRKVDEVSVELPDEESYYTEVKSRPRKGTSSKKWRQKHDSYASEESEEIEESQFDESLQKKQNENDSDLSENYESKSPKKKEKGDPETNRSINLMQSQMTQLINNNSRQTQHLKANDSLRTMAFDLKNGICTSVLRTIKSSRIKLTQEHFQCMLPTQMFTNMDQMMQDKVYADLEMNVQPIDQRQLVSFEAFLQDNLIMKYGFYTIATRMLFQLCCGLKIMTAAQPYGYQLAQICGLATPMLQSDEVNMILRCHTMFRLVQEQWLRRLKVNYKDLSVTQDNEWNMVAGGDCSIFDIIHELRRALRQEPELLKSILLNLKPDFFSCKDTNVQQELSLEFCILKITNKLARSGKNIREVFRAWDKNKSGHLDAQEILFGITCQLDIQLSKEECFLLTNYLDKDGNGLIEEDEFKDKINFDAYQKRSHGYLISETNFTARILNEYYLYIGKQRAQVQEKIKKFDENGDNLFQFEEYEKLLKSMEPQISTKFGLYMYKNTMQQQAEKLDALTLDNLTNLIMEWQLGGHGKALFSEWLEGKRSRYMEMKKKRRN